MKNRIVQKLCSVLLSLVIMLNIFGCFIGFTGSKTPQKSKLLVEAPIVESIAAAIAWLIAYGGGGSGSGSTKSPMPPPN